MKVGVVDDIILFIKNILANKRMQGKTNLKAFGFCLEDFP